MSKNIIIAILIAITALSFVYALIEKTEATKQATLADEFAQMAIANEKQALVQMRESEMEIKRLKQVAEECARTKK